MQISPAYLGRSSMTGSSGARILQLAPDLTRDRVAFDAPLTDPLRFREAISALHDVVINDLRYTPRDKSDYAAWKTQQHQMEQDLRSQAYEAARAEIEARRGQPIPREVEQDYKAAKKRYWTARRDFDRWLQHNNRDLWRKLMPFDPVITVADDTVFFECFSADESSYGCLSTDRESCYGVSNDLALGTTNVDYSWDLYHHFQSLRSYRETRFSIDPTGFEVSTESNPNYREEKIELPEGWLRGFMQMQSAMGLPMRRVSLSVSAMYSLLAFLKRHRAKTSPRAIRFELADGKPPRLMLEPWEQPIDSHGTIYRGPTGDPIRIWGRDRLQVLSRLLPLAERVDVHLLGTGLPSFWVVKMGSMRLTLGLSGWTTNDWTRGSAVDMLMPPESPTDQQVATAAQTLNDARRIDLGTLSRELGGSSGQTAAAMNQLALRGQAIFDLNAQSYRWRQLLPMALSDREVGPPHPERAAASAIMNQGHVRITSDQAGPRGGTILTGVVQNLNCEVLLDGDGMVRKGKCACSYFHKFGIRNGPCRHLQALRDTWLHNANSAMATGDWFDKLNRWAGH